MSIARANAEWVKVTIETGNDSILPYRKNLWRKTIVRCKICGTPVKNKDRKTRKLMGPYICEDHPIHRLDFEFNHEHTPIAGSRKKRPVRLCSSCGCNLSRYNTQSVCSPCNMKASDDCEG